MKKTELLNIIEDLTQEIEGKKPNKIIDDWLVSNGERLPFYKRLSFGYELLSEEQYRFIIRIHAKNGRLRRCANEIINKVGEGIVQKISFSDFHTLNLKQQKRILRQKTSKLKVGNCISDEFGNHGTLGGFLTDEENNKYILSCGHVLGNNGKTGINVTQPRTKKIFSNNNIIGEVSHLYKLDKNKTNKIDASLARINSDFIKFFGNKIPYGFDFEGEKLHIIPKNYKFRRNELIYKLGKKSALTYGNYLGDVVTAEINSYKFQNFHAIRKDTPYFSAPGDSGSIAFIKNNDKLFAVGIVVGSSNVNEEGIYVKEYYICPINIILEHFNVTYC